MGDREIENWIDGYLKYQENTESAKILHKWVCLSLIASCLRKKVHLSLGRLRIYANMYVVFVGPPGGPRKSQAISWGRRFLSEIPDIVMAADVTTYQALVEDIEKAATEEPLPDGSTLEHSSITVVSREFESFLGQKGENTKMIVCLTDLFDAEELPWKYRTKHSGNNVVPSVFLNLQAATTPESIASSLPSTAIGGGLTTRIIFVWATNKEKKVTAPVETPAEAKLKASLVNDLYKISRIAGTYRYSDEAFKKWDHWYQNYEEQSPDRLCLDPSFSGWYERKPLYLQKLTMIHAAAETSELTLEWRHAERAFADIEEIEKEMGNVFKAVGRSMVAADVDLVETIVESRGWITEEALMSLTWRDVDSNKLDNVINTLKKKGTVKRSFIGPKGQKGGIWYKHQSVEEPE